MQNKKDYYTGVALAIVATIIWAGNFVISKGVSQHIQPISLAFYRWLLASLIIIPIGAKRFRKERAIIFKNIKYLFCVSLSGIALFNTFVYVAGHHTSAINMALIGTTSSPIFATIMAVLFLKESMSFLRLTGMIFCITGIVLLISQGSFQRLLAFHFSAGDLWILTAGFCFAVYSILVRKKPAGISSVSFLLAIFVFGTLMLFPFYITELFVGTPADWNWQLGTSIIYLGIGTSVISFLCWNISIQKLGAGRTVLFGNLIPIFSTIEAVLWLGEKITTIHIISGVLVISGLVIANAPPRIPKPLR